MLFVSISFNANLKAEQPEWIWAKQGGGSSYNSGREIETDGQGNVYVTGYFESTGTFGTQTLTSAGGFDAFVVKYDQLGNTIWANRLGGAGSDYGISLKVDLNGNVYVTGYFSNVMITPVGTITSVGLRDVYLAKYNTEGTLLWIKQAGSSMNDEGNGLGIDNQNGKVYLTGKFNGTIQFADTQESLISSGNTDIFIAAYNFDGSFLWAKRSGGTQEDIGFALGVDATGNVYGTGTFRETADFGSTTLTSNGVGDIVVFKLDGAGNWIWAKNYGGLSTETGWDIAVDNAGNNWITGVYASASINFDDFTISNTNIMQDVYVFKQNADGDVLWANSGGSLHNDYGRGIAIDSQGNCYIGGEFQQTATFGNHQLMSRHNVDAFVVKYTNAGIAEWAISAGGQSTDVADAIAVDSEGNIFVTGYFYSNMIFGDITLTAAVSQPVFVAKLGSEIATYTLTYLAGSNGSIEGESVQTVIEGGDGTAVTAVADAGYQFAGWSDGSTQNPRTDVNVMANLTVTAEFALNTYIIAATAGANGTITPSGNIVVDHGQNQTFSIVAGAGYHITDVVVDGISVGAVATYQFVNVTANHSIHASFALNTYIIAATAGANGTITPSGNIVVNHGQNQTFSIVAGAGYHISDVVVDGVSVGAVATYQFVNVTANHSIHASFALNTYTLTYLAGSNGSIAGQAVQTVNHGGNGTPVTAVANTGYHFEGWNDGSTQNPRTDLNVMANLTVTAEFALNTYIIAATAGANGTITPSGNVSVLHGSNQQFEFLPQENYIVLEVIVDGLSHGAISSYEFIQVAENHTIHVDFVLQTAINENDSDGFVIKAYPNPAKNNLVIDFKQIVAKQFNMNYAIVDFTGRIIKVGGEILSGQNQIDVSQLSSGLYQFMIFDGDRLLKTLKISIAK